MSESGVELSALVLQGGGALGSYQAGAYEALLAAGQPIGVLKVWRNDSVILEMPLKAAEIVDKGNLTQRAFDAVTEMMVALFRAGAERL